MSVHAVPLEELDLQLSGGRSNTRASTTSRRSGRDVVVAVWSQRSRLESLIGVALEKLAARGGQQQLHFLNSGESERDHCILVYHGGESGRCLFFHMVNFITGVSGRTVAIDLFTRHHRSS